MRRVFLAGLFLLLAACATNKPAQVVYDTTLAYQVPETLAAHYAELQFCVPPAKFTIQAPCAERSAVIALDKANQAAREALNAAQDVVRNHPEVDASFAISAAQNAIKAVSAILALYAPGWAG